MSGTTRVLLALVVLALTIEAAGAKRARSGGAKHGDGEVVRAQGGPRTRRARPGVLELHELPGRPLYVRGGNKALQLTRVGAQSADALRSTSPGDGSAGKQAAVKQYLVRVWFPRPEGLADYLQELAGGRFFRYLPHDTYVIAMSKAQLEKARQAAGVTEVFELPAAMKIAPGLVARIDVAGSGGEGDMSPTHHAAFLETVGIKHRAMPKSHARGQAHLERSTKTPSAFVVQVMLASGGPGWALEAQAAVVAWEVAFDKMGLSITTKLVSPQKAVVTVEGVTALKKVTVWLSHQPLVHWVQEKQEITVRNSHATKAMQSVDASSRVVWNHGITGTGQVVGVADTGIDYDSCYFQDTQMPIPPRCSGTGYVMTAGCINQNHRKIVTYRKFLASDYTDYSGGHGTHVAGSVAGAALNASGAAASEYNGAAPGAKIAFDDVGDAQGILRGIPDDLASGLFPHSYAAGARIHSNSWGATDASYDMMAMEIDTFTNSHDDFLVLVAAGNDGPGTGTVGTPATAKNILAVGSTNNAGGASQIVVSMRVMYASTETTLEITPSTFGPSLTDMAPITNAMAVSSPLDGCTAVGSSLSGKIALVQRGTCNFDTKVRNAQNAGAVAVIVFNHLEGADVLMGGGTDAVHVTIPSAFIGLSDGTLLQAAAASGVTITLPVFSSSADAVQAHHTLASYSSRGPTNELRIKPDVVCPGTNIKSAHADGITTSNNCNFAAMSGTSMATPLCAGAAALVREYFVKGYSAAGVKDPVKAVDPSAALVKAVMIHSAQSVQTENGYETDYPNVQTGYGRVELSSILRFSDSAFGSVYKNRQTLAHGGHALFCFRVGASASKDLRVSLVWTDPAGDPSSMRSLVNDLDLIVHGPGDALFQGNTLKQTDETHGTYAVRDSLNNAEQVRVQNPVAGVYAVRVIGRDIPTGPQNFALVASASSMQEAPVAECAALQCPRSCSGIGQCLASGVCSCPLTHMGPDCSKAYKTLHLGSDATQTTQLSVTWLGMSYYVFQILDGGSFVLTLSPGIQGSTADADFYLAKDRLPTIADYDGVIADENSAGNFRSVGNARGIWVLGLQAYSGDVKVLASIIPGGTGGGTGDVDEGTGGGGTGGGGSVSGNCTEPCKCGRYTSTSGALADGSGPSNYSPNANCWWIIAPDSADMSNVTLTFTHFNTEFGYDTLNFYSCDDPWCSPEGLNMLGEMSGMPAVPLSIFSSTGYMLITFSSDDSISFGGFEGTWAMNMAGGDSSFYDGGPTTTPCSCGYSNATVGTIEDGSGDVNYPNNAVCRWIIEGVDVTTGVIESGTRVAIRFLEFVTEMEYDFVTIKECDSLTWTGIDGEPLTTPTCLQPRQIARISGFIDPGVYYYALTGIMEVIFTSDATVTRQGFVGEWTVSTSDEIIPSVCTPPCECGELTAPRGMLVDGSSEGTYPNNADCTWTIVVSGAEWIKLSFVKFELELNYDFLKIYQCFDSADCADSQGGTEIAHLTGVSIPKQLTAVGGMRVHFTSDSTINKQGFTAVWTSSLDNDDGNNNDDDDESEGGSLGDECGQNRTTCEADLFCNYDENKSGSCERCSDCPNCFECGLPHRGALDCTRKCSGQMHWPYPPADSFWQSCALPGNWSRLKPDAYAGILLSGGLGQRIIPGVFDTWACHYAHQCVRRLDNASYVLDGSPGSAQSASECHAACQQNGFGCGFGVELLDEYRGSFNALSCMQTCMMRVNGVDLATCIERVDHVASGTECVVTIDDRRYHVCGDSALNATICDVAPTVASGRAGCSMGAAPRRDEVDPFCWVYNEISGQFEAFGYGSEVGLL